MVSGDLSSASHCTYSYARDLETWGNFSFFFQFGVRSRTGSCRGTACDHPLHPTLAQPALSTPASQHPASSAANGHRGSLFCCPEKVFLPLPY